MKPVLDSFELSLVEEQSRILLQNAATKPPRVAIAGQAILKILEAYRAALRVSAAEERAAWVALYVGALAEPDTNMAQAARMADSRMAEYRERFGGSP